LTGGIAHDFNNILGVILGQASLMASQYENNSAIGRRIESIRKSAQRAADLTQQLLGFSRRQAHQEAAYNLNSVIETYTDMLARAVTPEIKVQYRFDAELWSTRIDRGDFEDALLNLVVNARDAMDGRGRLTITTRNCVLDEKFCALNKGAMPGEYVQLSVSDSGAGIEPAQKDQVFEPFFTTKSPGKGTGLGLAMVYGFTKRSAGYITIDSHKGLGTTLDLYLPRGIETVDVQEPADKPAEEPSAVSSPGGATILVVDDEPDLLTLAREWLESLGYRVLTAGNGLRALEILDEGVGVDLLFSDVVMPQGMNGYELAERACARCPGLRVLLNSGYSDKIPTANGQARFSANLLSKPYSLEELARQVRGILAAPNMAGDDQQMEGAVKADRTVKWTRDLSVGVEAIDHDHQHLLALLNDSRRALADGETGEQIASLLDRLMAYTQTHFKREEAVMAACGYPGLDNHYKVHRLLVREVEKMYQQMSKNTLSVDDVVDFLSGWWVAHIGGMDRAITPYCQGKDDAIAQALLRVQQQFDEADSQ